MSLMNLFAGRNRAVKNGLVDTVGERREWDKWRKEHYYIHFSGLEQMVEVGM